MTSKTSELQRVSHADLLMNLCIGAGDGVLVPLALCAGLTGAGMAADSIRHLGLIIIPAAAVLMGVGGWLTRRGAVLKPANILEDEWKQGGRSEEESRAFFASLGMDEQMQQQAVREMQRDDETWKEFIDRYDDEAISREQTPPALAGLLIGFSYLVAGLLILLPFYLATAIPGFRWSCAIAAFLLLIIAWTRSRLLQLQLTRELATAWITATIAAAAAFLVCRLIF